MPVQTMTTRGTGSLVYRWKYISVTDKSEQNSYRLFIDNITQVHTAIVL